MYNNNNNSNNGTYFFFIVANQGRASWRVWAQQWFSSRLKSIEIEIEADFRFKSTFSS